MQMFGISLQLTITAAKLNLDLTIRMRSYLTNIVILLTHKHLLITTFTTSKKTLYNIKDFQIFKVMYAFK